MTNWSDAATLLSAYVGSQEQDDLQKHGYLDPYLLWQVATNLRGMQGSNDKLPKVLTFIVETNKGVGGSFQSLSSIKLQKVSSNAGGAARLPTWLTHLSFYQTGKYVNFRVATDPDGTGKPWFDRVMELATDKNTVRMQLGYTRRPRFGSGVYDPSAPPMRAPEEGEGTSKEVPWYKKPKVVLGVLEDSCPFAHNALRRGGTETRVVAYWNQSDFDTDKPPPGGWAPLSQAIGDTNPYGLELTLDAMNRVMTAHTHDGVVDEEAVYTSLDMRVSARMRESHAGLVIPLMAGPGDRVSATPSTQADEETELERWTRDPASEAPLIAVNLPRELVRVSSGRWMGVQILDGLHYIASKAEKMCGKEVPVVVNVSYGAIAGPHDGSGIIEEAMNELTNELYRDRLAIVLAAGNAHGTVRDFHEEQGRLPSGVHSSIKSLAGGSATFTLWVPPEKQRETFLELWFSNGDTYVSIDDGIKVCVRCEDRPDIQLTVAMDAMDFWPCGDDDPILGLFAVRRPAQSKQRSMALIVLTGTELNDTYASAPSGRWTVTVTAGHSDPHLKVEAWVERDEVLVGLRRPQSARLICDSADDATSGLSDFNTLNNIATGQGVFVVGALNAIRGFSPLSNEVPEVSAYSSATKKKGQLDFSAVADSGYARSGIRTGGNRSGMVVRANGTSLAAPQAARWIANQLAINPSVQVLRNALPQGGTARKGKKLLP